MAFGAILGQTFDGYTKEQTLSDQTKLMLGLPTTATPDEAFVALYFNNKSSYLFAVTVLQPDGQPWPNLPLFNVTNINGGSISTDENGYALCMASSATPTLTAASNLLDVNYISQQLNKDENFITSVTVHSDYVSNYITITDSKRINRSDFSSGVTSIDFTAVGGGGGGGAGNYSSYIPGTTGGGGGGGGYVSTILGRSPSSIGSYIDITIGAGGTGGTYVSGDSTDATNGGVTTVVGANSSYLNLTANGGNAGKQGWYNRNEGGTGNGDGGRGAGGDDENHQRTAIAGTDGTGYIFNNSSLGLAGGGGGGGAGNRYEQDGAAGGSPNGAAGPARSYSGNNGSTPGGGGSGGGSGSSQNNGKTGGNGGSGAVYIRFNH